MPRSAQQPPSPPAASTASSSVASSTALVSRGAPPSESVIDVSSVALHSPSSSRVNECSGIGRLAVGMAFEDLPGPHSISSEVFFSKSSQVAGPRSSPPPSACSSPPRAAPSTGPLSRWKRRLVVARVGLQAESMMEAEKLKQQQQQSATCLEKAPREDEEALKRLAGEAANAPHQTHQVEEKGAVEAGPSKAHRQPAVTGRSIRNAPPKERTRRKEIGSKTANNAPEALQGLDSIQDNLLALAILDEI
eukprot:GHVT01027749.1.p1 GENE.GHVT01027749.1~~GHVT01027749.1.p1  ORF type:complete len:288 (-),score=70.93 GHVT01027749.1:364-1110(-)